MDTRTTLRQRELEAAIVAAKAKGDIQTMQTLLSELTDLMRRAYGA